MRKSDDNVPNIQTEVEVMKTLDHERIVRLYDSDWDAVYVKKNGHSLSLINNLSEPLCYKLLGNLLSVSLLYR